MTLRHAMTALAGAAIALLAAGAGEAHASTGLTFHLRRCLVLDQSMITAALDEMLEHGGLTRYYPTDPVGRAARPYLAGESFSIALQ